MKLRWIKQVPTHKSRQVFQTAMQMPAGRISEEPCGQHSACRADTWPWWQTATCLSRGRWKWYVRTCSGGRPILQIKDSSKGFWLSWRWGDSTVFIHSFAIATAYNLDLRYDHSRGRRAWQGELYGSSWIGGVAAGHSCFSLWKCMNMYANVWNDPSVFLLQQRKTL